MGLFGRKRGGLLPAEALTEFLNRAPEDADYAQIGRIALLLTSIAYQLERLVWYYMGDLDRGHIATARLGSVEMTDTLKTLVEWTEPDDEIAEAIEWSIKSFHILRENRNSIIHGFNFSADRRAGTLRIERRTKSLVFDAFQVFEINRGVLAQVVADQYALGLYLWRLDSLIRSRPKGSIGIEVPRPPGSLQLPARPAQPASLIPLPREAPKSARRLRRELAEKEAKKAKLERKAQQRRSAAERKKK